MFAHFGDVHMRCDAWSLIVALANVDQCSAEQTILAT